MSVTVLLQTVLLFFLFGSVIGVKRLYVHDYSDDSAYFDTKLELQNRDADSINIETYEKDGLSHSKPTAAEARALNQAKMEAVKLKKAAERARVEEKRKSDPRIQAAELKIAERDRLEAEAKKKAQLNTDLARNELKKHLMMEEQAKKKKVPAEANKQTTARKRAAQLNALIEETAKSVPLLRDEKFVDNLKSYAETFNKNYNTKEVLITRSAILHSNLNFIDSSNSKSTGVILGTNRFTDLENSEYSKMLNLAKATDTVKSALSVTMSTSSLPSIESYQPFDWVKTLPPVKEQGLCSSCWAFAVVATLESQYYISKNLSEPISLSEQQLVDCASTTTKGHCKGCQSGLPNFAFQYTATQSIALNQDYEYISGIDENLNLRDVLGEKVGLKNHECRHGKYKSGFKNENGYRYCTNSKIFGEKLFQCTPEVYLKMLSEGPMAVVISASSDSFRMYKSGVWKPERSECSVANHVVTAVGWGVDSTSGKYYILIRNSWGKLWVGESGYMRIAYDPSTFDSCFVSGSAFQPIKATSDQMNGDAKEVEEDSSLGVGQARGLSDFRFKDMPIIQSSISNTGSLMKSLNTRLTALGSTSSTSTKTVTSTSTTSTSTTTTKAATTTTTTTEVPMTTTSTTTEDPSTSYSDSIASNSEIEEFNDSATSNENATSDENVVPADETTESSDQISSNADVEVTVASDDSSDTVYGDAAEETTEDNIV